MEWLALYKSLDNSSIRRDGKADYLGTPAGSMS